MKCRQVPIKSVKGALMEYRSNYRKWAYWCDEIGIGEYNWMLAGWRSKPCEHIIKEQEESKRGNV